jgi:ABC-type polysaccharide/polyol phosphate export permease
MLTVVVDVAVAVPAFFLAWMLRFGDRYGEFAPFAWRALPIVVGAQVLVLLLAGAYRRPRSIAALGRFVVGSVPGSIAGGLLAAAWHGRDGLSIAALGAGAMLFLLGGVLWRSVATVVHLSRHSARTGDAPAGLRRVGARSPTLGTGETLRYRMLVRGLVARDLKLKYRGSALGFLWSLVNPLVMVAVYTVAFTYILNIRSPGFVLHIMLGLLSWTFFASSAMMSTGAIADAGGLLKSVAFPRQILPVSTVLFNLAQYVLTIVVFLPIMLLYYRLAPTPPVVLFPVFVVLQTAFTIGVALTLSAVTTVYRDVKHLTEIGLGVLFWLTPVIYSLSDVPEGARALVLLTPLSGYITAYQSMFYDQAWPNPAVALVSVLYAVAALAAGTAVFVSVEDRFGELV